MHRVDIFLPTLLSFPKFISSIQDLLFIVFDSNKRSFVVLPPAEIEKEQLDLSKNPKRILKRRSLLKKAKEIMNRYLESCYWEQQKGGEHIFKLVNTTGILNKQVSNYVRRKRREKIKRTHGRVHDVVA